MAGVAPIRAAPRDFDISPYFKIVKPTLVEGFNYKSVHWADLPAPFPTCSKPSLDHNPAALLGVASGDVGWRHPTTGIAGCCARAASGHATAPLPSSVVNPRRFMSRAALSMEGHAAACMRTPHPRHKRRSGF